MKRQRVILLGIALVGACVWWRLARNRPATAVESGSNAPIEAQQKTQPPQRRLGSAARPHKNQKEPSTRNETPAVPDEDSAQKALAVQEAYRKEFETRWNAQWSTAITFHGKVVDQADAPVPDASVAFEWADRQGESQTAATVSDGLGFFFLRGIQGRSLNVRVSKEGYALTRSNHMTFLYADLTGRGSFTPDAANPVLFRLRKRGPGTDLITSQYGVKDYLGLSVPLDGSPIQVDLLERKTGQGELRISQTKPPYENWKQATEWAFRMEIPGGGFVECNDEFPFEAPETGYKPTVAFSSQKGETGWATHLSKDYYIKFSNPVRFGRLHLETSIMMSGARLTYAINPHGSRYLEQK